MPLYVSHGRPSGGRADLDSVASIAYAMRASRQVGLAGAAYRFIDYIDDRLDGLARAEPTGRLIAIIDIPLETLVLEYGQDELRDLLASLCGAGNRISLVDHHPLTDEDRAYLEEMVDRGLVERLLLPGPDERLSSTELLRRHFADEEGFDPSDPVLETLERFARDQDLAVRSIPEANRLTDVIVARHDLERLVDRLSEGVFWDEGMEAWLMEARQRTRALCQAMDVARREIADLTFAYCLLPDDLKATPASEHLFEAFPEVSVVALFKPTHIALRRRFGDDSIDLSLVARTLGGGGHPGAAVLHGDRVEIFDLSRVESEPFEGFVDRLHRALTGFVDR